VRISVDGTDFRIQEPRPFNRQWYSQKFKGPAVRYEIGVCIRTGWIVWVNGPFACGKWPDLKIFKEAMIHELDYGERVVADGGYPTGNQFTIVPRHLHGADKRFHSIVRARHEIVNRRIKQWRVLGERYRNQLLDHGTFFWAVAVITQVTLREESVPFHPVDWL